MQNGSSSAQAVCWAHLALVCDAVDDATYPLQAIASAAADPAAEAPNPVSAACILSSAPRAMLAHSIMSTIEYLIVDYAPYTSPVQT